MRVIVTRPQPECTAWAKALSEAGLGVHICPLMVIEPVAFAWDASQHFDAVMWVSRSAVEHFGESLPHASVHLVTGMGSATALLRRGIPPQAVVSPAQDAPQLDSEHLWLQMQMQGLVHWQDRRVLVVRGRNYRGEAVGRNWLAGHLRSLGAQVAFVSCYCRQLPAGFVLPAAEKEDVWLFSSGESLAHLGLLAAQHDWSKTRALCTHARIAHRATSMGFGHVQSCMPTLVSVLEGLRSPGLGAHP